MILEFNTNKITLQTVSNLCKSTGRDYADCKTVNRCSQCVFSTSVQSYIDRPLTRDS